MVSTWHLPPPMASWLRYREIGFSGDKIERDFTRETLSPLGHVIGVKRQTLSFSTELKGADDDTDPDKLTHFDPF